MGDIADTSRKKDVLQNLFFWKIGYDLLSRNKKMLATEGKRDKNGEDGR